MRHQHNEAKTELQSDKCAILPFFVIDDINSWIILLFACMPNVVFKEQNIESPTRRRWLKKDFISRDVPFSIPKTIQWQKFRIKQKSISSYKKSVGIYVWIHYVWQAYNVWKAVSAVVPHTTSFVSFLGVKSQLTSQRGTFRKHYNIWNSLKTPCGMLD